jgi:hypothetical protein
VHPHLKPSNGFSHLAALPAACGLAPTLPYIDRETKATMLKITTIDSASQRTLVLEGKLVDPWVAELEKTWHEARRQPEPRRLVIDLENVTVISQHGENVLFQILSDGAQFCCNGVLTKHVLQELTRKRDGKNEGIQPNEGTEA